MNPALFRARLLVAACMCACGFAAAQSPVVYPARGQSAAQVEKDRFACHEWAKGQSGFDPAQPAPATSAATGAATPTATAPNGSMARGAAGGAAVAELSHNDVGHGAAVGALGGALRERARQQQAAQARQQQAAQQQAARNQQRATYERAFAACMEGRGYVLK